MIPGLSAGVDWAQPAFAPLRPWGTRLAGAGPIAERLNLVAGTASPRFVAPGELPAGEPYEVFIARTGCVPTRDHLHDLFNGLVWQRQPALKGRLNELQAAQIAAQGVGPVRGPLRDALTLFDEFGALWADPPAELADALRRRDWQALFVAHRALWAAHEPELFGHALMGQLATAPRKGLTAHVALGDPLAWSGEHWATKPFLTLPVLGIPLWWPANEDPAFYMDTRVFRPARA